MSPSDRLRDLHSDPAFAARRDERARDRFTRDQHELQRRRRIAIRGYDVPPELEAQWRLYKRKRMPNREIAKLLGLKRIRRPRKAKQGGAG